MRKVDDVLQLNGPVIRVDEDRKRQQVYNLDGEEEMELAVTLNDGAFWYESYQNHSANENWITHLLKSTKT